MLREPIREGIVGKDMLDLRLCVIEVALDSGDGDVGTALSGHLQSLNIGDFAMRIEHRDAHALNIGEALEQRL